MAVNHPYPGVYIEELPSGVRTITGVSTSLTAFVGAAKRGPVGKPVAIQSYSDFERRFGGLERKSEMTYAVRQFFANGGSEAIVVRVAKGAKAATLTLTSGGDDPQDVLRVSAVDKGQSGNYIEVRVDYDTRNPDSTFNLVLLYEDPDNPADNKVETFLHLSMNSDAPRYVLDLVNDVSELVTLERIEADVTGSGRSVGKQLESSTAGLLSAARNQFRVAADGSEPITVTLASPETLNTPQKIVDAITLALETQGADTTLECSLESATERRVVLSSTLEDDEHSTVRVLASDVNDCSAILGLGLDNGGQEIDAAGTIRPGVGPNRGKLEGGAIPDTALDDVPSTSQRQLRISVDGDLSETVVIDPATAGDLAEIAARIEAAVRGLRPSDRAYADFTAVPSGANAADPDRLTLQSGTRGMGSSVRVETGNAEDIAETLLLLPAAATATPGANLMLTGGAGAPYDDTDDLVPIFLGSRVLREGLYALESADLFNLLCLPGISNPAILSDAAAYCRERRAFLLVDAAATVDKPDDMLRLITGTDLPKTDHAAVYYPWIKISDPLNGGKPRSAAPSGTIAGLYARTDSTRGVWKAPAGTDGPLVNVRGVNYQLTDGENGRLNPRGANCVRVFPVYGAVCWGARTLFGDDQRASEWKYVPIRRTALYIEESLYRGLKWVVFEPNDEPLWGQVRLNVGAFMHGLFRQGAFQGSTPRDAYFVRCDKETTTQNDINQGVVNIIVGFAPLKPAEFVIVKIQQMAGQIQT